MKFSICCLSQYFVHLGCIYIFKNIQFIVFLQL